MRVCEGCGQGITPDFCWCGDSRTDHFFSEHPFIPMGCSCHRDKPHFKTDEDEPE